MKSKLFILIFLVVIASYSIFLFKGRKKPKNSTDQNVETLNAIYPEVPELFMCKDGKYTTGGCNHHGGKVNKTPVDFTTSDNLNFFGKQVSKNDIYAIWLNVDIIKTDPETFQNREDEFSEDSVNRIVDNFDPNQLDPVTVWKDPAGSVFMLSGHSRLEAHKRLGLKKIPARFFEGDKDQAKDFSLFYANRGQTPETLREDIKIFIQLRDIEKLSIKDLKARFESSYNKLENYSFLNINGDFLRFLSLPKNQQDQFPLLEVKAGWTGYLRKNLDLTDAHEQEIFNFLYRNQKGAKLRKEEFLNLISDKVNTIGYDKNKPLALELTGETGVTARADTGESAKRIREINATIRNLNNVLKNDSKADREGITRTINRLLAERERLENGVRQSLRTQTELFGLDSKSFLLA